MILFDLDDTLLDHRHAERKAAEALWHEYPGLFPWTPADFARRWHEETERHFNRYARGEISHVDQRRERMRALWNEAGAPLTDAEADEGVRRFLVHYERAWTAFPDALPCLDTLAGEDLGLLSNGRVDQQTAKLEALGIHGRFRVVVISEGVGFTKPDPRIFREACKRAGKAPSDCLYVGDKLETDALAARAAGLKAVWLDRLGEDRPCDGVPVVRSLSELPAILRRTP